MLSNLTTGKILVTGAAGFLGSNISRYLTMEGFDVLAATRKTCDLRDSQQVEDLFNTHDINAVVHCAAKTGYREDIQDLNTFYENILIYENLTRSNNSFFINLGSGDEFDHTQDISEYTESQLGERIPKTPYGFSKYVIANRVRQSSNAINFRLFNVFGPDELANRFITTAMRNSLAKKPIMVYENIKIDFFYVKDLCLLIDYYLKNDIHITNPGLPRDMNVCYNLKYTLHEIADKINSLSNQELPIWTRHYNKESNDYYGSGKLLASLDLPFLGLEEGLSQTYKILKNE